VFRFQSFLFNPNAKWSGLLKPDILNILGLGLAGTSFLMGRATTAAKRWAWLLLPAFAIVALTPLSRMWWWPTLLHPRLEAYIRPVGNFGVFSLFPWVAYVPLGAYMGAVLLDAADGNALQTPRSGGAWKLRLFQLARVYRVEDLRHSPTTELRKHPRTDFRDAYPAIDQQIE
jgi:hypothetical protein